MIFNDLFALLHHQLRQEWGLKISCFTWFRYFKKKVSLGDVDDVDDDGDNSMVNSYN